MSKSPTKRTAETNEGQPAKADAPKKLEEVRTVTKEFSFGLEQSDLAAKAQRIADLGSELSAFTERFEQAKSDFKAAEARIEAETARELRAIRSKSELRSVEVEQVSDFVRGIVFWRHVDRKGELVTLGERRMEQAERQPQLPLEEKPEESKPGKEYLDAPVESPEVEQAELPLTESTPEERIEQVQ